MAYGVECARGSNYRPRSRFQFTNPFFDRPIRSDRCGPSRLGLSQHKVAARTTYLRIRKILQQQTQCAAINLLSRISEDYDISLHHLESVVQSRSLPP